MSLTPNNTEVVVYTFESINLGPEVHVEVVGQRALILQSRTSVIINTTIKADPGTLGGFKGGGRAGLIRSEAMLDNPRTVYICDLGNYCNDLTVSELNIANIYTANTNGPGSGGNITLTSFGGMLWNICVVVCSVFDSSSSLLTNRHLKNYLIVNSSS